MGIRKVILYNNESILVHNQKNKLKMENDLIIRTLYDIII